MTALPGAGAGAGAGRRRRAAGRDRGAFGRLVGDGFPPEAVTKSSAALGDHPQLLPAARLLQPDLLGARRPGRRPDRATAPPRRIARIDVETYQFAADMNEPDRSTLRGEVLAAPGGRRAGGSEATPAILLHRRPFTIRRSPRFVRGSMFGRARRCSALCRAQAGRVTVTLTMVAARPPAESARGDFQEPYRDEESGRSSANSPAWCSARPAWPGSRPSSVASTICPGSEDLVVALREDRGR